MIIFEIMLLSILLYSLGNQLAFKLIFAIEIFYCCSPVKFDNFNIYRWIFPSFFW